MTKTGRNDPCPCGSGKKYKKCCLRDDTPVTGTKVHDGVHAKPIPDCRAGLDIHPYAIAKIVENPSPATLSALSKRDIAALKDKWSIGKVGRLETSDIVERLRKLGMDGTQSAFLALANGHTSAWSVGTAWVAELEQPLAMHDEDFVFLAACELWKRYCPERPSDEMVDDWVTSGYDHTRTNEDARAVDIWLRVWEHVRHRLEPHMTTFRAADTVFKINQFFGNWVQDFEISVENAALHDRKYAEAGIRLVREILRQFVDEDANTVLNFRCDLGRLLFLVDQREEGEATLLAVIREYPHLGHGYITLSDQLGIFARGQRDYPRAIALLEQALLRPVEDADDWGIDARLTDLRAELAKVANEERRS